MKPPQTKPVRYFTCMLVAPHTKLINNIFWNSKHVQIIIQLITAILLVTYETRRKVFIADILKTPIMNSHDTAKIVANNINKCCIRL